MQWSILVAVLALAGRASATLAVQDGKFSIVDSVSASIISSDSFSSSSPALVHEDEDRRPLSETDVLKLAFTVTRDGKPFQPQQASLVVVNPLHSGNSPTTAQFAIKVRPNSGKAKWDSSSSPAIQTQLASLDATTVDLTLVVGHPHEPEPLQIHLGRIQLPPSFAAPTSDPSLLLPKHWEAEKYAPQPEIVWTFRDGEKSVNPIVALVGLAVVLAPWVVLLATVPRLVPNGRFPLPSGTTTLFLLSLLALESLSVISWVYFLPVLHTLPYFAAIAATSVLTGRRALGEMAHARKTRAAAAAAGKVPVSAERKQL
ncbi:hypothetical protein RHOSPDRAFT_26558 [Rhodotorula sp. JG-1b]|nr:hypothetical protein RHOSPDRAFT_26558 [Rhodotorula sp. JG-1b]